MGTRFAPNEVFGAPGGAARAVRTWIPAKDVGTQFPEPLEDFLYHDRLRLRTAQVTNLLAREPLEKRLDSLKRETGHHREVLEQLDFRLRFDKTLAPEVRLNLEKARKERRERLEAALSAYWELNVPDLQERQRRRLEEESRYSQSRDRRNLERLSLGSFSPGQGSFRADGKVSSTYPPRGSRGKEPHRAQVRSLPGTVRAE